MKPDSVAAPAKLWLMPPPS